MAKNMVGFRSWLRPPRNLLVLFLAVVALPAATLVVLGLRLMEQDRALARQRQTELLEQAADRGVRALHQDLASLTKRLAASSWAPSDVPEDSVYVVFRSGSVQASPAARIPYYPVAQKFREPPAEPFADLEREEFRTQNLEAALASSRKLAATPDLPMRAGALLRQARILRKLNRPDAALEAYAALSRVGTVSIGGVPADLVARRTRCVVLEEQSRQNELRQEAAAIAADLRGGKWQLDRTSYLHVAEQLGHWLGTASRTGAEGEALAEAVAWLWQKWPSEQFPATGAQCQSFGGVSLTIVWASGAGRVAALVAGPRYFETRWLGEVQNAARPARAHLTSVGEKPTGDARRVQRTAAETGLPWTLLVAGAGAGEESSDVAARRRTLLIALGALFVLIAAGSYLAVRSVNRELAVVRLQSDFVAAVSHEFRTPLTTLRQFNELLELDDLPSEKRHSFQQAQTRATERLQRLVEALLDFGRMEAGHRPYRLQRLDAAALACDVAAEFRREVDGRGFAVECQTVSGGCPVDGDAEALSRAVWNLLDNAAKYSREARSIELAVERANGAVTLAVRDHGMGIPPSEQKRIFQKFMRGAEAKSQGIKGTGIGLAMVEHIVKAHGGNVKVESAPGEGSTFTIVLPAKE